MKFEGNALMEFEILFDFKLGSVKIIRFLYVNSKGRSTPLPLPVHDTVDVQCVYNLQTYARVQETSPCDCHLPDKSRVRKMTTTLTVSVSVTSACRSILIRHSS